jgi:hypothetical protein
VSVGASSSVPYQAMKRAPYLSASRKCVGVNCVNSGALV